MPTFHERNPFLNDDIDENCRSRQAASPARFTEFSPADEAIGAALPHFYNHENPSGVPAFFQHSP
ncbi:hypothetical protein [Rhizobium leguminosarum]|uniref:Uncharacterized protein n=1 Tax=Rhizobium leguminosarum TaxID=384 RepID=A0A7K3VPA5_RHILE|nr:hypothetical protein [Rhizobium leguminosarum]NEK18999.1 hypothetical protein [Rhizobium leguminosarum]